MTLLLVVLATVGAGVLLYLLHRTALWAEDRGWIFYKHKRGPAAWLGTLESIYKPEVEYVVEEESSRQIRADQDESGADPNRPTD